MSHLTWRSSKTVCKNSKFQIRGSSSSLNSMENSEHLIFVPGPGMGHVVSAVQIGKLILSRDTRLSITYLLIKDPHAQDYIQSLKSQGDIPRLQFLNLPEPEEQNNPDPNPEPNSKAFPLLASEHIERHKPKVREAVHSIIKSKSRVPALIIDMFCTAMIDVGNEFGIPTYVFFSSGAAFLSLKLYVQKLTDEQNQDITEYKDSDKELSVPGFANSVPTKVLPSVMLDKNGGNELVISTARRIREAKGIFVNTFQELEHIAIESLSDSNNGNNIPRVYPMGPIIDTNIKQEFNDDDGIIRWLDDQPSCSVVFLCFGSQGSFSEAQIKQVAIALERTGFRFLWSLRRRSPVRKTGSPDEMFPEGFLERTCGVGKVIGWAPQVAILSHPAVGGFVSHCGWNSILESLWFGVPIAAWPMYAEQQVNAFQMVVELGVGVEIKMDYRDHLGDEIVVSSYEIEKGIMKLMTDREIREKVKDMKENSHKALREGGSSYKFLGCLINDILHK